jgi:hypothetical protein
VALATLGACGTISTIGSASSASAATSSEILLLGRQPCPAYHVASSRTRSPSEVAAAKDGNFEVRKGKPAHLVPPVDWTQDPYDDRSWVHYLHAFRWLDQLLYAYVHDGNVHALAQSRDLLLDWIASNPLPSGAPEESWMDKAVGDRSGYLGYVIRAAACRGLLSNPQASTLLDSLRQHAAVLSDPESYQATNHGLFADLGLALIGNYVAFLGDGQADLALARSRFRSTLASRLEEREGVWLEQSTVYQFVLIALVQRFASLFEPGGYDEELARMRDAAGWLVTPGGDEVAYGDTRQGRAPEWAQERAAGDEGLRLMPRSGLAAVNDGGGYLLVTAGFHNRTHKHADDLGFQLYDRGRDVITDSGNSGYNTDRWRDFSRSVAAHSVLSVGAAGFPIDSDRSIYGSGILAGGSAHGWYAIEGRNPVLRTQGVRHRRLFLYRPGRALLLVDLVEAGRRHTYHRRLQLAPGLQTRRRNGELVLRGQGFHGALRDTGDRVRLQIVEGRYKPPGGWAFPAGRDRVARSTVELTSKSRRAKLVSALGLRGAVSAKLLHASGRSLRVHVRGPALEHPQTVRVARSGEWLRVRRKLVSR